MITMAYNPPLKELFRKLIHRNKNDGVTIWSRVGKGEHITSRSWMTMVMIIEWYKRKDNTDNVTLFIPEYYCYETVFELMPYANIVFYPLKENMDIDFNYVERVINQNNIYSGILLFCHFWGKIIPINNTSIFCKKHRLLLVEDAVHVLYPDARIGEKSDFVIFSPWKILGLPDGAIVEIGKKNVFTAKEILCFFDNYEKTICKRKKILKWIIKKLIIKVVPNNKDINLRRLNMLEKQKKVDHDVFKKVSDFSRNFLLLIGQSELENVLRIRQENFDYMLKYVLYYYPKGVTPLLSNIEYPYMLPLRCEDLTTKNQIIDSLVKIGCITSSWPDIAPQVPSDSQWRKIEEETVAIAIHPNISERRIRKRLKYI